MNKEEMCLMLLSLVPTLIEHGLKDLVFLGQYIAGICKFAVVIRNLKIKVVNKIHLQLTIHF